MHLRVPWLVLLASAAYADAASNIRMFDLYIAHPSCDDRDMDGLRDDTEAVAQACVNTLYDLRDRTWDRKPVRDAFDASETELERAFRRSYNRFHLAHLYLGTTEVNLTLLREHAGRGQRQRGHPARRTAARVLDYSEGQQ